MRSHAEPMDALVSCCRTSLNGVSLGLLFALIALGFMLIVGVMETINLAHGSLFALGMYVALFIVTPRLGWFPELQAAYLALPLGTRYAIALLLAPVLVGVFGMLLELCMRRTYGKRPALRPAAHLRRGAGDRGADPRSSGARPSSSCRCPRRSRARSCSAT